MSDDTLLYHVTNDSYVEQILTNGLRTGKDPALSINSLSEKEIRQTQSRLGETRTVDQIVERARPSTLPTAVPDRTASLYFWTTPHRAKTYAGMNQSVLVIDASEIPGNGAIGNGSYLQAISNAVFEGLHTTALYPDLVDDSSQYAALDECVSIPAPVRERAEAFWTTVTPYERQHSDVIEAWFACDIPPEAIVAVNPDITADPPTGRTAINDVPDTHDIEARARQLFDHVAHGAFADASVDRVLVAGQYGAGTALETQGHLTLVLDISGVNPSIDTSSPVTGLNQTERHLELLNHRLINDHREWFSEVAVELAYRDSTAAAQAVLRQADLSNPSGPLAVDLTAGVSLELTDLIENLPEDVFASIAHSQFQDDQQTMTFVNQYYSQPA